MDSVEILDHFNQARAYPFDALSHYLNESLLHPQEHIQSYQRGHCLDLAVSLCCALGQGAEIVGNIKPGWLIPTHYAVYYREPTTHWWLDPSVGVAIPLKVGTAFDLNGKRNVLTGVWSDHFELVVEGGRTIFRSTILVRILPYVVVSIIFAISGRNNNSSGVSGCFCLGI
jgi:hypothetical protein